MDEALAQLDALLETQIEVNQAPLVQQAPETTGGAELCKSSYRTNLYIPAHVSGLPSSFQTLL